MFCASCGNAVSDGARFCRRCGEPVDQSTPHGSLSTGTPHTSEPPAHAAAPQPPQRDQQENAEPESTQQTTAKKPITRWNVFWLAIAGLGFIGSLIPLLGVEPETINRDQQISSAMIGLMVWSYVIARNARWKRPGLYPLYAFGLIVLVYIADGAYRGFVMRQVGSDLKKAMAEFAPDLVKVPAAQLDRVTRMRILNGAMQRAPDAALIDFDSARVRLLDPSTGGSISQCAAAARGRALKVESQLAQSASAVMVTKFLKSAGRISDPPKPVDGNYAQDLLTPIYEKADPKNAFSDSESTARLTDEETCTIYLRIEQGIHGLPESDAAMVLRYINLTMSQQ